MAASKSGPHAPKTVCGRRHCRCCKHWRLLIDFGPRKWADADKTIIKYVHGECYVCARREARERYHNETAQQRKRRNQSSRVYYRRQRRQAGIPEVGPRVLADPKPGSVDRRPFAAWLQAKVDATSVKYVARRTKLPERRIRTIINGYDKSWPLASGPKDQVPTGRFRPARYRGSGFAAMGGATLEAR
jgi:hypothetical protein